MAAAVRVRRHLNTCIIEDHSGAWDVGAVRPMFHVERFAESTRVRFILEISNTENFRDQDYSLELLLQGWPVYQYAGKLHHAAGAVFTRVFWLGEPAYPTVDLAALAAAHKIPNFDPSYRIPESVIANQYAKWLASPRDAFQRGLWETRMGAPAGRPDIGIYPTWVVLALYSSDPRMWQMALGMADLAGAWPYHIREGDPAKSAYGRPIRITDRPTIDLNAIGNTNTSPSDRITPTGPIAANPWQPDQAHAPDVCSVLYTVTRDPYYLDEHLFFTSWMAGASAGPATKAFNGRGPTGAEGGTAGRQTRSEAWTLRHRVEAWNICPPGPERDYYAQLVVDQISTMEGQRGLDSPRAGNACWTWGNQYSRVGSRVCNGGAKIVPEIGLSPLHAWEIFDNLHDTDADPTDISKAKYGVVPFEQNFLIYALGRAKELGFPTWLLLSWLGANLIAQITKCGNPWITAFYKMPVVRTDGKYCQTWADMMDCYEQTAIDGAYAKFHSQTRVQSLQDHGYAYIAMTAAAMITDEPGGREAWEWIYRAVADGNPKMADNPKWSLLPRRDGITAIEKE